MFWSSEICSLKIDTISPTQVRVTQMRLANSQTHLWVLYRKESIKECRHQFIMPTVFKPVWTKRIKGWTSTWNLYHQRIRFPTHTHTAHKVYTLWSWQNLAKFCQPLNDLSHSSVTCWDKKSIRKKVDIEKSHNNSRLLMQRVKCMTFHSSQFDHRVISLVIRWSKFGPKIRKKTISD